MFVATLTSQCSVALTWSQDPARGPRIVHAEKERPATGIREGHELPRGVSASGRSRALPEPDFLELRGNVLAGAALAEDLLRRIEHGVRTTATGLKALGASTLNSKAS